MRKTTIATIAVLLLLAGGGYLYVYAPFHPDRGEIEALSNQFMEDLQFKDFHSSALYHHELEQDRVDIGRAIEDLFLLDPELLDIMSYRITRTEIDSSGDRARVLVNTRFRPLKPKRAASEDGDDIEEADLQLYWMRRHPDCPLGTDCEDGACRNQSGKKALNEEETGDDDEAKPFVCDEGTEKQWYMNLDSTLESRDYR